MLIPQWLQTNPYRILRLPASASITDAHKAASAMRRMAVLELLNTIEVDVPSLGEVPRNETDIRAAVGRLESPSQRIADRLFWLHSAINTPDTDSLDDLRAHLKKAAWEHDQALQSLFSLYGSAETVDDPDAWTGPLKIWQKVIENDDYWKLSLVLDQLGTFEPRANADEVSALRAGAMAMASEPLLMLARQVAVANGDRKQLEASLRVLRSLSGTGDWAASARREILAPLFGFDIRKEECPAKSRELWQTDRAQALVLKQIAKFATMPSETSEPV